MRRLSTASAGMDLTCQDLTGRLLRDTDSDDSGEALLAESASSPAGAAATGAGGSVSSDARRAARWASEQVRSCFVWLGSNGTQLRPVSPACCASEQVLAPLRVAGHVVDRGQLKRLLIPRYL
jgi:hypothetical protein